jgi:hypothetical protein
MLSKSLLEWPRQASAEPGSGGLAETPSPLDSQAWAPTDSNTFDALWRTRIGQR